MIKAFISMVVALTIFCSNITTFHTDKSDYEITVTQNSYCRDELKEKIIENTDFSKYKNRLTYKMFVEEFNSIVGTPIEMIAQYNALYCKYENYVNINSLYKTYTIDELDMLFRVVQAEIGDEWSFEQKCNVVSVIFNRIDSNYFGNSMYEVLRKDQFESISDGRYLKVEVSSETILACEYVFVYGRTTDCLFFDSNGVQKRTYQFIFNDGAHNFYNIRKDK